MNRLFYFDANALVKYYRNEDSSLWVRRLVSAATRPVILSPLTIIEYVAFLMYSLRDGRFRRRDLNKLVLRLRRDIGHAEGHRPFQVLPVPDGSFTEAESILLRCGRRRLESGDGLHLGILVKLQATSPDVVMVSFDEGVQSACTQLGLPFCAGDAAPIA